MKQLLYVLTLILGCTFVAKAEDQVPGNIVGIVRTNDGQPAPMVTVLLKGKNRGDMTNEKGEFNIRRVQPGTYTLQVSLVGFETAEQTVTVEANQTAEVNIDLQLNNTQLNEVIVKGTQLKGKRESDHIARLPIKNLENPQVYNTFGQEVLKEQVVVSFDDAMRNAPGVNKMWSSTGRPNDGASYFSMRGFAVQPSMINGIAGLTNGSIDPANVEHIETIKGPSGTLFGSSLVSFGGLINIVTKKPYDHFGGELSYTGGGFGLTRITADVNAPLNADKSALLRVNAAYHNENSFQDAGFRKSFFVAPSFSYQVNDRLSFNVNAEFYNGEGTNPLMVFLNRSRQLKARTPKELGMDFDRSYTSNDVTNRTPTMNLYGQMNYKLSDKWTSQTNLSRSNRKSDGYYQYVMFLDAPYNPLPAGQTAQPQDSFMTRYAYTQNSSTVVTGIQQNFIGDFKLGSMRNRLVFGLDFLGMETTNNNSPYAVFDVVSAVNPADPRYGQLNRPAIDAKLAGLTAGMTRNRLTNYTYSAYVSDVLNVTDKLLAMASVRVDYFENKGTEDFVKGTKTGNFNQTSISPKFGLVYQVVKDRVALFANYMNGFKNVAPATMPLPELNGNFKPQHANQYEGGVKVDLLKNRLNASLSYYDIEVNNMNMQGSIVKEGVTYNYTYQGGTQRSKGVEFDLNASPVEGLNIIAGYAYNNSKMVKADKFTLGRRPVSAGPEHFANLWATYTVLSGKLNGFGVGAGGNYAGDNVITNDSRTGTFTLPAYTVFNASVFYNVKAFRLALKMDNIANKEYFTGWTTIEKQMPRRVSANVTFKF
ncbi:TonB-dependent siderophore receptor [Chitinophaga sp. NPDC101104]|uniref:TonB-dependent siderophore receptor n=1 Tax=Chitinophaga sp. NPDC101104 TaxID=3390561 RepID=UPI003D02881C